MDQSNATTQDMLDTYTQTLHNRTFTPSRSIPVFSQFHSSPSSLPSPIPMTFISTFSWDDGLARSTQNFNDSVTARAERYPDSNSLQRITDQLNANNSSVVRVARPESFESDASDEFGDAPGAQIGVWQVIAPPDTPDALSPVRMGEEGTIPLAAFTPSFALGSSVISPPSFSSPATPPNIRSADLRRKENKHEPILPVVKNGWKLLGEHRGRSLLPPFAPLNGKDRELFVHETCVMMRSGLNESTGASVGASRTDDSIDGPSKGGQVIYVYDRMMDRFKKFTLPFPALVRVAHLISYCDFVIFIYLFF
jgi:hypothetical protein